MTYKRDILETIKSYQLLRGVWAPMQHNNSKLKNEKQSTSVSENTATVAPSYKAKDLQKIITIMTKPCHFPVTKTDIGIDQKAT